MQETIQVTNVNPLAFLFLVLASLAVLCLNRQHAASALLVTALLVPFGQQLMLLGLHWRFVRLLILVGVCRLVIRGEARALGLTSLDKLLISAVVINLVCGVIRDPKAEIFGAFYDALGVYFLFRFWTDDARDMVVQIRILALVAVVIAVCMARELITHQNLFSVFGGVPEITLEREGRFRCQGPFRHPILAGTFSATLFPLLVGLWFNGQRDRTRALLGILSCVFCSYVAASSGAFLTLVGAMIGLCLWPMRRRMHLIRWGLVVSIVGLAIVMNAPVWYLISRVGDLAGGTGWHRAYLIDQAIKHFGEWWLVGSSYTAHWACDPFTILPVDPDNMDITNHYVEQGLKGGLLGLCLFLAMIVSCFKIIGRCLQNYEEGLSLKPELTWVLGVSLAATCLAFISVCYFDQILVFWLWLLAVISALSAGFEVAESNPTVGEFAAPNPV